MPQKILGPRTGVRHEAFKRTNGTVHQYGIRRGCVQGSMPGNDEAIVEYLRDHEEVIPMAEVQAVACSKVRIAGAVGAEREFPHWECLVARQAIQKLRLGSHWGLLFLVLYTRDRINGGLQLRVLPFLKRFTSTSVATSANMLIKSFLTVLQYLTVTDGYPSADPQEPF